MYLLISIVLLISAWTLAALDAGRAPTWFYVIAWYPTLGILDAVTARRTGQPTLLHDPPRAISLLLWSVPLWLIFEAANFRLQNWYYVLLPAALIERWTGIVLSFATVVPAIVLMERLLDSFGVGARWRTRPVRTGPHDITFAWWMGWAILIVTLIWPRQFFPLIWGAAWLLAEPVVFRLRPQLSLFHDLTRGDWGRAGRLMLGGLAIGALWETYNHWARGRWIYTVPGLDGIKWFEMPPLGFVGFTFFALEAWSIYHALCAAGVAHPAHHRSALPARRLVWAGGLGAVLSVATLLGMERWTISSVEPRSIRGQKGGTGVQGETMTVWEIARGDGHRVAVTLDVPPDSAASLIEWARIVTLRGIGTERARELAALGIRNVCELADVDPDILWSDLQAWAGSTRRRPAHAEVNVWVQAAARECRSGLRADPG